MDIYGPIKLLILQYGGQYFKSDIESFIELRSDVASRSAFDNQYTKEPLVNAIHVMPRCKRKSMKTQFSHRRQRWQMTK